MMSPRPCEPADPTWLITDREKTAVTAGGVAMAVRDIKTEPDSVRPKLPKSKNKRAVLFVSISVIVVAAVLIPTRAFSHHPSGAISIPSPPAITFGEATVPSASASAPARPHAKASASASPAPRPSQQANFMPPPIARAKYAGSLVLNATGAALKSWNSTSSFCQQDTWEVGDGKVSTDSSDDAVLATTGKAGSCVGLVSPGTYSSAVVEAYVYFPPLPGNSGTIANWTSLWLTDQANWPADGELDATEAEPATGVNAVAYHWGSADSPQWMSTDGYAANGTLPVDGTNLKPGWHVVDIAYTKGFFAVYYDGKEYTSLSSDIITGDPVNIIISSSVTPDDDAVEQTIGTAPVNSDSSPAGMAVKYVKVWSYK